MELTNITTSYSRKLSHGLYGGGQYETSDHFMSLSADLEEGEDVLKAHKELKEACKGMVDQDIEDEITSFSGGQTADAFYTYLRDMVSRRKIAPDFYEGCNQRQKAILQAVKRGLQMEKRDNNK